MSTKKGYFRPVVKLSRNERRKIESLLRKGVAPVRMVKRAQIIRLLDKGHSPPEAADAIGVSAKTARDIRCRYIKMGLEGALYECPRQGHNPVLNQKQSCEIVAMVCSGPPQGFSRWTLELITEEAQKRKIVFKISKETIRLLMKNHKLKPWRLKMWCIPKLDEEYIKKMEDVLDTYEKPYNPKEPVVCLDERPVQLLAEARPPIPAKKPGQIKKQDSEYIRHGTANVFCAIEGKAGRHFTFVTKNRKGPEFAKVLNKIAKYYPASEAIHLVLDNLNTHNKKPLIDYYGEERGENLWKRFFVHYTPKHGSWLNQAEIEIGIYSKQCLGKDRIATVDELRSRSKAWNRKINLKKTKINWKFTTRYARKKFRYK